MAGVIYQDAINVIPNDTINIPQPGPIVSGNNSSNIAAIIRDASKDFRRQVTNPQGYNVGGGSVVYNGGNIGEVIEIFGTTQTNYNVMVHLYQLLVHMKYIMVIIQLLILNQMVLVYMLQVQEIYQLLRFLVTQ